jgi:putative ABC transport system permease protein
MGAAASRLRLFSLRELAVHRRRTVASIAVMAVSAMYLVAVFGIFGSITGSVNRLADGIAGIASLEVSGITDAGFPDAIAADVAAVPGVATAAPMIRTSVSTSAASAPVLLFGADDRLAELGGALKDALKQAPGQPAVPPGASGPANTVRVGPGVGHAKGETFQLGSASVTVGEVLTGKQAAELNGGHYVLAPLALAQNITGRQGQLDSILITTKPGADLAKVRAAVTAAVNGRAIVADPSMRATRAGDGVKLMNYMALMGRIAIGRLPPAMTQGLEARIEYWLPGYAIPAAIAATALTSVVASAMAARQVYKVAPIEALAPVGVSAADRVPRWLRIASGVAAAAVFVASTVVVVNQRGAAAFIAMSAVFSAEIALGFALTVPIVKATAATARIFGSVGALAAATIERAPRRVWATVMTVLIAVVTTVAITGTNNDMIRSARDIFAPVADVPVWVSANPPDSYPTDALPQGLSEKVAGLPGVQRVIEGASGFAEVGGTRVMLDGFSAGTADPLFRALNEQVRAQVLAGRGVVLSQNLGSTLHVRAGEQLRMQTPHGVQQATVLALVPYFSTVIGTVGMGLDQMRSWFDRPVTTTLEIAAAPGTDPNRLLADVRRAVPAPNFVYDGRGKLTGLEAPMHQSMFIANAVWIIVVLVAGVALLNTLTLSVLERRREIGVLRAMGSSRRFTLRMVLAEATGIGVVGGVLGLLFGLTDQWLFSLVSGDMMNFRVAFRPSSMALVFTVGALAISLLGSVPPARRAARLNIIEAVSVE